MKKTNVFAKELIDFCYASPSAFHAVESAKKLLHEQQFIELQESEDWKIKAGGKYYVVRNDSALLAFVAGSKAIEKTGFRIVGAHGDSPCFRIKPAAEMVAEDKYLKLNTEVYGGPILSTWFDRPLAIAGRVVLQSPDIMNPLIKLININRPLCIIPNIAIHMNPDANNGFVPNKQTDTLPIVAMLKDRLEQKNFLLKLLAAELKTKEAEILDFDLFLYEYEKGCFVGANNEFISCSRIDDLEAVHAGISALCAVAKPQSTCVMACFDNEEVGSSTRQGADSQLLSQTLERIVLAQGKDRSEYFKALALSFLVSADGAHAVHPNMGQKADPTSRPLLNSGVVIKLSANKSYTSDAVSAGAFIQLGKKAEVSLQRFVNRSDMRGGSTIGPISATHVSIPSIDVGIPMLAMHSIREMCGVDDHLTMFKLLCEFYSN